MKAPQLAIMLGIAVISIAAAGLACETKAQKQPGLQRDLPALFQELEKYGLLPEMTSRQELEILQKLAATLKVPMFFEQQCQEQEKSEDQEDDKIPAAAMLEPFLEQDGIFYLRLENFRDERLLMDCASLLEQFEGERGQALVLDLRQAWGFSGAAEKACYQFVKELGVPIVALVDHETAGTAESLLQRAQAEGLLLVMGKPSLGIMGAGQQIKLPSGLRLRVPVSANLGLPTALQPDLEFPQKPVAQAINRQAELDPYCLYARDTLKTILVLGQKPDK